MAKIELKNVAHSYSPDVENPEYALKKCNLSWKDGGRYAVLGPSGCGKTTMLNIMSGLVTPSEGTIKFDGIDITNMSTAERNIAQVFQFPVIYNTMTVAQNLGFPLLCRNYPKEVITKKVDQVAQTLGISGPATTVAAACASSGYALALGKTWLTSGLVDACVVGGCDVLSPTALAAFHNLRALSRRDDDPQKASRPFDRNRDGFVMGEGGVFFVLERQDTAENRQCKIYGELAGIGMSSDASHMVTPCSNPVQASRAITEALADASLLPKQVDYINAHAAGTPVGDTAEAGAIRDAFGHSHSEIPVSSTKSMSGHLISAAAAFEALACLVAIQRNIVPPTINLDEPDDDCRLRHIPHQSIASPVHVAASNSFGFGGSNLCLVLKSAA